MRQHLFLLFESDHYLPTRAGDTPTTKKGEIEGLTKGTWGLMTCQFPWFLVGFSLGVAQDSNDWNDVTLIRIVETLDLPVKGWPKGTLFGRWWTSKIYIIETHLLTNSCSICFFLGCLDWAIVSTFDISQANMSCIVLQHTMQQRSKTFHTQPKRRSLAAAPFRRVVGCLQFCHSWWWFKPGKIYLGCTKSGSGWDRRYTNTQVT